MCHLILFDFFSYILNGYYFLLLLLLVLQYIAIACCQVFLVILLELNFEIPFIVNEELSA